MKEKEREDYESRGRYSHSHSIKKKCKKKRSPVEDETGRRGESRRSDDSEGRRKDYRGRDGGDDAEPRRKERDYHGAESRRKDREDEGTGIVTTESFRRRRTERDLEGPEQGRTSKCVKHRRRRDELPPVKEELLSQCDHVDARRLSPRNRSRSRSPRNQDTREDRSLSNMEALVKVEEEKHDWGSSTEKKDTDRPKDSKAKPDFGLSGKLSEETNIVNGVFIKYSEPEEARKPRVRWRLYPFKGDSSLPVMHLHRQSAYLIGRDRKIADLPVDHPSCSKQHAVLQYRLVPYTRSDGSQGKRVRPYIIDLESANGTFVNNKKIEPKKYVELLERDVVKFAFSSREYVLLHEHSKDAHLDDDVQ